jgi:hypothetical protein
VGESEGWEKGMIWNIFAEERRIAKELLEINVDFGVAFAKLPDNSAVRIAPLNRSTRPLPTTKIPDEYLYLVAEWAIQDVLFTYLQEIETACKIFGWRVIPEIIVSPEVPGLRGHELIYAMQSQRDCLWRVVKDPWYAHLRLKCRAWYRLEVSKQPASFVRPQDGVLDSREVL